MIAKEQIGKQLTAEVEQPAPKTKGLPMLKLSTIFAMTFGFSGLTWPFRFSLHRWAEFFKRSEQTRPSLVSSLFFRL